MSMPQEPVRKLMEYAYSRVLDTTKTGSDIDNAARDIQAKILETHYAASVPLTDLLGCVSSVFDQAKDNNDPITISYGKTFCVVAELFGDPKWIGWGNHDLGKVLKLREGPTPAIEVFKRSLKACEISFPEMASVVRGDLGSSYLAAGKYQEARPLLEQALSEAIRDKNTHNQFEWSGQLADLYVFSGENKRALDIINKWYPLAVSDMRYSQAGGFLTARANALENMGRFEECIETHHEALRCSKMRNDQFGLLQQGVDHENLARLHYKIGESETASNHMNKAIELAIRSGSKFEIVRIRSIHLQHQLKSASDSRSPLAAQIAAEMERTLEELELRGMRYHTLRLLPMLASWYRPENPAKAKAYLERSIEIGRENSEGRSIAIDLITRAHWHRNDGKFDAALADAREASAIARAIDDPVLIASSHHQLALSLDATDAPADEVWAAFSQSLNAAEMPRIHAQEDQHKATVIQKARKLHCDAVSWLLGRGMNEDLLATMERSKSMLVLDARAAANGSRETRAASADSIREAIDAHSAGTLLVSMYTLPDELVFAFARSGEPGTEIERIPFDYARAAAWHDRWTALTQPQPGIPPCTLRARATQMLRELNYLVAQPIFDKLNARETAEVIICPHGPLHSLPIHAALGEDGRHLADTARCSYTPAIELSIAPERIAPQRTAFLLYDDRNARGVVKSLPLSSRHGVPVTAVTGLTKEQALAGLTGAELIHITCHGEFTNLDPFGARFRLAGDEHLMATDIAAADLRSTRLVITLSCDSALSVPGGIDEPIGLTRAWLMGGSASVLSCLWEVRNRTCDVVSGYLDEELAGGVSPAEALRNAIGRFRTMQEQNDDPRHWAAFVLSGTP